MDKNVKIAKELLRLAKSLVAEPRGDYKKLRRPQQYENELKNDVLSNDVLSEDSFIARLDSEYKRVKNLLSANDVSVADVPGSFAEDLEKVKDAVEKGEAVEGEKKKELERVLMGFGFIDENKMKTFKEAFELKKKVDELYEEGKKGHESYYDGFFSLYKMDSYQDYEFSIYCADCGLKELKRCEYEFTNAINHWKQCPNILNWVVSIYNSGEQGKKDVDNILKNTVHRSMEELMPSFGKDNEYIMNEAYRFLKCLKDLGYKYNENYTYGTNSTENLK